MKPVKFNICCAYSNLANTVDRKIFVVKKFSLTTFSDEN